MGLDTEKELHGLLYWIVRTVRPRLVAEVLCGDGHATEALGSALADNEYGVVVACDTIAEHVKDTLHRCRSLPVEVRTCPGIELPELRTADVVFLGSGREDLVLAAKPGAIVVVNDTGGDAPGAEWIRTHGGMTFGTPDGRGFGLMRRTA